MKTASIVIKKEENSVYAIPAYVQLYMSDNGMPTETGQDLQNSVFGIVNNLSDEEQKTLFRDTTTLANAIMVASKFSPKGKEIDIPYQYVLSTSFSNYIDLETSDYLYVVDIDKRTITCYDVPNIEPLTYIDTIGDRDFVYETKFSELIDFEERLGDMQQ